MIGVRVEVVFVTQRSPSAAQCEHESRLESQGLVNHFRASSAPAKEFSSRLITDQPCQASSMAPAPDAGGPADRAISAPNSTRYNCRVSVIRARAIPHQRFRVEFLIAVPQLGSAACIDKRQLDHGSLIAVLNFALDQVADISSRPTRRASTELPLYVADNWLEITFAQCALRPSDDARSAAKVSATCFSAPSPPALEKGRTASVTAVGSAAGGVLQGPGSSQNAMATIPTAKTPRATPRDSIARLSSCRPRAVSVRPDDAGLDAIHPDRPHMVLDVFVPDVE